MKESFISPDCCAGERAFSTLVFTPELPKPGERVRVVVNLPEFVTRRSGGFQITVREFDSEKIVFSESFVKKTKALSAEVFFTIPDAIRPGYYIAVLSGPGQPEIASELLILVDTLSIKKFDRAQRALQCIIDATRAREKNELNQVVNLLEQAADHYANSESPQCAGFALVDAAEASKMVQAQEKAESLSWMAVKFFLLAGDNEAAADLVTSLVNSSESISEAVGRYVTAGRAVLEEIESNESELPEKKVTILRVAERSLPAPRGERLLETMLVKMRSSRENQYFTDLDELLYLAQSEIALYSPGVVMRSPGRVAVHCATFVSEFQESSHTFAAVG